MQTSCFFCCFFLVLCNSYLFYCTFSHTDTWTWTYTDTHGSLNIYLFIFSICWSSVLRSFSFDNFIEILLSISIRTLFHLNAMIKARLINVTTEHFDFLLCIRLCHWCNLIGWSSTDFVFSFRLAQKTKIEFKSTQTVNEIAKKKKIRNSKSFFYSKKFNLIFYFINNKYTHAR